MCQMGWVTDRLPTEEEVKQSIGSNGFSYFLCTIESEQIPVMRIFNNGQFWEKDEVIAWTCLPKKYVKEATDGETHV